MRYLLNVSYIGTAFRGVTFIEPYYRYRDLRTVQGVIENAVKFYFKKRCEVNCSSRTDARVHAISSTFDVNVKDDIVQEDVFEHKKYKMIATLNETFKFQSAAIRVNDIEIVNENTFMAYRNVENRSYLYRIATTSDEEAVMPIEELDRCFLIKSDVFDMNKFQRAAEMFVGRRDFRSFMRYSTEEKTKEACYAQRKMISITITPSKPCILFTSSVLCDKHFKFYDIYFTANSYVYRQIRRIIGALCALAMGKITERDIYELLTIPSMSTWNSLEYAEKVETAPAYGLYFIGIKYKPEEEWTLSQTEKSARGMRLKSFRD